MTTLLLVSALMIAEPTDKQLPLLKIFHQEFISITPGRGRFPRAFTMGVKGGNQAAEQPAHEVTVAHDFQVAKYEVPQDLWEAVMGSNPSRWKGPRNSVEMLTFAEAEMFCAKVTWHVLARRLAIHLEMTWLTWMLTVGTPEMRLVTIHRWVPRNPTPGNCMTCMAISGNGAWTPGMQTISRRQWMVRPGNVEAMPSSEYYVVAVGRIRRRS